MKIKNLVKKVAAAATAAVVTAPAFANDEIWAAVDLSGTTAKVVAAGVIIVGITMAFKSIGLGKRAIKAA